MLSAKDAFKVGFLSRCVEDGLSPAQIEASVKQAQDLMAKRASIVAKALGGLLGTGKSVAGTLAHYGTLGGLIAPPVIGGALGYGAARLADIDETDVDDVRNQEVVDEYKRQTDKLHRLKAIRDFAKQQKHLAGRVLV